MIYIISCADNFRGYNTRYFMSDSELIKLNNDIMSYPGNKEYLKAFNIRYKQEEKEGYNNPVINFCILNSEYEYKLNSISNYESKLFEYVRNMFKDIW